jgi:hypothetical protein
MNLHPPENTKKNEEEALFGSVTHGRRRFITNRSWTLYESEWNLGAPSSILYNYC